MTEEHKPNNSRSSQKSFLPAKMPSADPSPMAPGTSKPFSISFGSSKPKVAPTLPPKKRPHSALADNSGSEDEGSGPQLVTAFDQSAGGAISNGGRQERAPLVIKVQKNRDWREESRKKRRKNLLPAEVQAARAGQVDVPKPAHVERDEVSKVAGLEFVKQDGEGDTTMLDGQATERPSEQPDQPPKTADEEALEALLGGEKKSTLKITAIETARQNTHDASEPAYDDYQNEDDRFKADVASRPDVATLDDYAAVPVEEFGAAMLRGMGWKEGEAVGKRRAGAPPPPSKPRNPERRPALLGIGAKEVPGGVGDEFGAWGKVAKGKRKTDLAYSPVVLRNSVTGELLTEEELEAKKREAEKEEKEKENGGSEDDWRERRDRNLKEDVERKEARRDKARERLLIDDGRNGDSRGGGRRREIEGSRRDRSREDGGDSRRRERSREGWKSRHSSSRRHSRDRDGDRSYSHSSSRRERSRSAEKRHRRH